MSNLVQSLLESANPYQDQLGVSQKLSKKWAKSGAEARQMLERLVSDYGVGKLVQAVRKDQTRWQLR